MLKPFLLFCSLTYLIFGGVALIASDWMFSLLNIGIEGSNALNDLKGSYGGLNMAVGLFLLLAVYRANLVVSALFMLLVLNSGYVFGRIVSMFTDGMPELILLVVMSGELIYIAVSGFLLKQILAVKTD